MEQQVLQLLQATTVPNTETIKRAERSLVDLYRQNEYPFALLTIATHSAIEPPSRKAALTALRNYVNATWSPTFEEASGVQTTLMPEARSQIREQILAISTSSDPASDNRQSLAASVVSKIASVDFPDQWPELFPRLIGVLGSGQSGPATMGSLRVLLELVDSGLTEDQFFAVAHDLVTALQHAAINAGNEPLVQAMTINVLRSCFETLEQVLETEHASAVKAFLDESMKVWMNYFLHILKEPLPEVAPTDFEHGSAEVIDKWKGLVALKIQVVKTFDKIKRVYMASLTAHIFEIFQVLWEELSKLQPAYTQLFIERDSEGKLVDSDGLPYTLDALVIEDLDFIQSALKAKSVRAELQKQAGQASTQHATPWLQELLRILVLYSQIPQEEEGIWQYDANIYLSETTSVTANYTPRAACADLLVRSLMEWLKQTPVKALIYYNESLSSAHWREREAGLFLLNQGLKDLDDSQTELDLDAANTILQQSSNYIQDGNEFLRAAAHLCLGTMFSISSSELSDAANASLALAIKSINEEQSQIVSVCSLTTIPQYLGVLPASTTAPSQVAIIDALKEYLSSHTLSDDLEDSDDVKSALIITLRDTMLLNTTSLEQTAALDIFFDLCSDGASNFMLSELLVEMFETLVESVADHGKDVYIKLCEKTIPSLSGAFHIADMRQESSLTNLAAELVSALAEYGFDPLPDGFVSAVMPQLHRVLMEATEATLVRPATQAVAHMLNKGSAQFLAWTHNGKSSVELTLIIINRLLNSPDVDEAAADQVGSLAASLIDKCGAEGLGTHLPDLLQAVAARLASATRVQFIQSTLMVFASLAIKVPNDVITFLGDITIPSPDTGAPANGLNVVMTKWLENSVHFAGFEEIRQNSVALSKIYALHDPRVSSVSVKGDLVVNPATAGRIKTRSQSRVNPDTWTTIPADLKILKLLVDELKNAATSQFTDLGQAQAAAEALEDLEDDDEGDGEWEDDDDGALDLSSEKVRNQLMAYGEDGQARARDDETAGYLIEWFKGESGQPGFQEKFERLKEEEQSTLRDLLA